MKSEKEEFHRKQHEAFRKKFIDKEKLDDSNDSLKLKDESIDTSKLDTYNSSELSQDESLNQSKENFDLNQKTKEKKILKKSLI